MSRVRAQRGNLVLMTGVLGSIASVGAALLFQLNVVLEKRAIEENLAQTRTYWAAMGAFNYVLSRTNQSGACKCDFDTSTCNIDPMECTSDMDRVYTMQAYYAELGPPIAFEHPNMSSTYVMNLTLDVQNDETGSSADNGHLKMVATVSSVGTHSFLSSIAGRLDTWEMGFCIDLGSSLCPAVNDDLAPAANTGRTHIKYVRRQ